MACVIGYQRVDYVSKKTGNPVKGYRIHATETVSGAVGMTTVSEFVSDDRCSHVFSHYGEKLLGQEVRFFYNKYGNCDGFEVLESK